MNAFDRDMGRELAVVHYGDGEYAVLKPGRHVRYEKETPMTNLHLALLDRMGVKTDRLGDSTSKLERI